MTGSCRENIIAELQWLTGNAKPGVPTSVCRTDHLQNIHFLYGVDL